MAKKQRPARRIFGRPKEGPGPQQTFEGQFQVETSQAPSIGSSHQSITVPPPTPPQNAHTVQRSISAPTRGRGTRRDAAAGSSRHGERRPSMSAHNAPSSSSAQVGCLEAEPALVAGPSRRRRPSVAGHRATQSHPTVLTVQAAGGTFNRSRSSGMLASETRADSGMSAGEPSSWPRVMHPHTGFQPAADGLLTITPIAYRGPNFQTPSTPGYPRGQHSPSALSSSNTPSTGSLLLMSPPSLDYRRRSHELPETSPTNTSSWHYPSPAPSSMRGASIPPSVQSEPSPRVEWLLGDFSPAVGPSDTTDLPPLTPEMASEDLFWDPGSSTQPHNGMIDPTHAPNPFELRQYSQSNTSVPDLYFPSEVFGASQPMLAFSHVSYDHLQGISQESTHTLRPPDSSATGYSAQADHPPGF